LKMFGCLYKHTPGNLSHGFRRILTRLVPSADGGRPQA
jgi:hypothetical protein